MCDLWVFLWRGLIRDRERLKRPKISIVLNKITRAHFAPNLLRSALLSIRVNLI